MNLGGWLRQVFSARPRSESVVRVEMFDAGYQGWRVTDQLQLHKAMRAYKIDRKLALSVPAVLRGRNLICGDVASLPLQLVDTDDNVLDNPLFQQFDRNVPNVVMIAMTVEDLLFEAKAWWRVTEFTALGMPAKATRYDPTLVSMEPPSDYMQRGYLPSDLPTEGVVYMDGEPVPFAQVIRFDSPNPPILVAGERSIQRALLLDDAADLYATNRRMRGFFKPADPNVDPGSNEVIQDALNKFATARRERLDGYVPAALEYVPIQDPTPAEIQIIAQQNRADLALANALGIDPEDLGINTTSRTYQNAVDRRQDRINDLLAPFMRAVTDRLSMPDVTSPGETARFQLDDYLKADPKTRAEVQQSYKDMGVIDSQDIQREEGIPRKVIAEPAPLRPAVPPTQISAIPAGAR
jgi:hypothetical protein